MNLPKIICPNNKKLLKSFTGRTVAVNVNNPDIAAEAAANVQESSNNLFCVIIKSNFPLDSIKLHEEQKNIPLAIIAPSIGKFRDLVKCIDMMRGFNLRVYLPLSKPENYTGFRILSSVGVHSCALFVNGKTDWEALTDLMTYAVLERAPHASIEPFEFISSNYDPFSYLEWGAIHFNDPNHFLHLDSKGRVALSHDELIKKRFIAESILEIKSASEFPAVKERMQLWRNYFADSHPCASCGGWKICLGKFSAYINKNKGCSAFFMEMIEVSRQHKARNVNIEEHRIWQP